MPDEFEIWNGILLKYHGSETHVTIPDSVTKIEREAFQSCNSLTEITIPDSVSVIGYAAFQDCKSLVSVDIPAGVTKIDGLTFKDCESLESVHIPDSVTKIGIAAFKGCVNLPSVTLPDGVTEIGYDAFRDCARLRSVSLSKDLNKIDKYAFTDCSALTALSLPDGVETIEEGAFRRCMGLTTVRIPESVTFLGRQAFAECADLTTAVFPGSETDFDYFAFDDDPKLTIICREGSAAQQACLENKYTFIFDYQFEAFHGILPQGFEKLASPFLADEEKPFIFISYSHRDRDEVLQIIKTLYESGWKIWYDEGLTIGDRYDETLEEHVRNCSAFLLFVTEHSLNSYYCRENEIPWAIAHDRPIIRCNLREGLDYEIPDGKAAATVIPAEIERALGQIEGVTKGEPRVASGISVVVNPADRDAASDDGFACCLYTAAHAASAKAILLEAKNSGCTLYDAAEEGLDGEKLRRCACLIVFLDKAFLADETLTNILTEAYLAGRDIAVCQLESISNDDLPQELLGLHKMQWLHFAHGITADMNTKLARHLQKRGCRNAAALPGFEYETTEDGIVINRYIGNDPSPWIASEYGGTPVVKIAWEAFKNCVRLQTLVIPEGVREIEENAFEGCGSLTSVTLPRTVTEIQRKTFRQCGSLSSIVIPESVTEIGESAFCDCASLTSFTIPDGVREIADSTFEGCSGLSSVTIPGSVTEIGYGAFAGCSSLTSILLPDSVTNLGAHVFVDCTALKAVSIPDGVAEIDVGLFEGCTSLTSVTIPDSVTEIGNWAFSGCTSLSSVILSHSVTKIGGKAFAGCTGLKTMIIPEAVTEIGTHAFQGCTGLTSITIPDSVTKIGYEGYETFEGCTSLTVLCSPESYAWKYCESHNIPVQPVKNIQPESAQPGLFARLFGKK